MAEKRKTYTSSEVKMRYNKKHYKQLVVWLPIEMREQYKEKCKEKGIPQSEIVKKAISDFLAEEESRS